MNDTAPGDRSTPHPAPETNHAHHKKKREGYRGILTAIAIIASAVIVAFCLRSFVFQPYLVDGASMETTLQNNNWLIVNKIPRTWSKITGHAYIPGRTEIVIFSENEGFALGSSGEKQLIKRIIGLPGERVVVKDGILTVYNKDQPDGFQPDKTYPYGKAITTTPGNIDVTVGTDEVFVCGDNRNNSLDSRTFGPIPAKHIVGKLSLRIFPLNKMQDF